MSLSMNKPPPRYAVSDWHTSNTILRTNAERLRDSSHTVRQDARRLRNETENHTRWTQHESNTKLEKRIDDINEWKRSLEKCLVDTDSEINSLQEEKQRTEISLEAKALPLNVVIECLLLRENRKDIDLVRDKVEDQLHKEVEVIEGIKALLHQKLSESFEQLCLLQEARYQIHCDLSDKCHALEIDSQCHQLNNNSPDINFQVQPTRTIKGSVTPETWDQFSQYNKLRGEAEMKASQRLREAIFATLEKTKNDLEAQRKATEYEFRKRIHETEQTKDELEWQQKNTKDEILTLEQDIEGLKDAIDAKMAPMKVAQTRLENRTARKNVELCRDVPQYQLCYEVGEIEGSLKALFEKLQVAESAHKNLLLDLARIENDLNIKINSLDIDNQCMKTREKLMAEDSTDLQKNEANLNKKLQNVSINEGTPIPHKQQVENNATTVDEKSTTYVNQNGHHVATMNNPLLKSTYNVDFEEIRSKRSGDLERTLGRPVQTTMADSYTREVLLD